MRFHRIRLTTYRPLESVNSETGLATARLGRCKNS